MLLILNKWPSLKVVKLKLLALIAVIYHSFMMMMNIFAVVEKPDNINVFFSKAIKIYLSRVSMTQQFVSSSLSRFFSIFNSFLRKYLRGLKYSGDDNLIVIYTYILVNFFEKRKRQKKLIWI